MLHTPTLTADVIVVGSGPGGATVARELARTGHRVLILECGIDHRTRPYYGTYLGPLLYADRGSFLFANEGLNIVRPLMLGGATSMYCGCAALPPTWLATRYGIDLAADAAAAASELGVAPLPPALRGESTSRIAQAGRALGLDWQPQAKFMRPERGNQFQCSANCMLGCRCGAKWNAAEFIDHAVAADAQLVTRAAVERVLMEGRRAIGVAGRIRGKNFTAYAPIIILAAGGIGTPRILQRSGVHGAGEGLTVDTTAIVYGIIPGAGVGADPPMTWSWHNDDAGFMLSTLIDPWLLYPIMAARADAWRARSWKHWSRTLGIMIKLRDEPNGRVAPDGTISKPLSKRDGERLAAARTLSERILREAGATADSIFTTPLRGTHPGSTVAIGRLLDTELHTAIDGLLICDASAFPEALGRPTVLTIVALARRLARHLVG